MPVRERGDHKMLALTAFWLAAAAANPRLEIWRDRAVPWVGATVEYQAFVRASLAGPVAYAPPQPPSCAVPLPWEIAGVSAGRAR